jgi:N-acetylglucosamine kinase-like BadF-type ATPase
MKKSSVVIGIECGKNGTNIQIASLDRLTIAETSAAPIRECLTGGASAAEKLNTVLTNVTADSGIAFNRIAGIVFTYPTVLRDPSDNPIQKGLEERWKRRKYKPRFIYILNSAHLALETIHPGGPALVASVDDSAFVVGRDSGGRIISAGGWGASIPDSGSSVSIAASVLRYIADVFDNRALDDAFFRILADRLRFSTPDSFRLLLIERPVGVDEIVRLTCDAARQRNPTALAILDSEALGVVESIRHCVTRLPMDRKVPLLLTGDVLSREHVYAGMIRRKIMTTLPHLILSEKPNVPVENAVRYAADLANRLESDSESAPNR